MDTPQPLGDTDPMQYMISFALTSKDYTERVNRFLDTGALPPEGATMLGRWISVAHDHGYILADIW